MSELLKIFTLKGCKPCDTFTRAMESGEVDIQGVSLSSAIEFVDLSTDEGFAQIQETEVDGVPSVYLNGEKCVITEDDSGHYEVDCSEKGRRLHYNSNNL